MFIAIWPQEMFWCIDITSRLMNIYYDSPDTVTLSLNSVFDSISYLNGLWLFLVRFLNGHRKTPTIPEASTRGESWINEDPSESGEIMEHQQPSEVGASIELQPSGDERLDRN